MFVYLNQLLDEYGHSLTYKNLYGIKVEPDPNREKRVQAVIASMGDKYLLANPIERKRNE